MLTRPHSRGFGLGVAALLLTLAGGLMAPLAPTAYAATTTTGTVDLSPTPPNETQAVPPNIAVTFDDSGSMAWDYMSDNPPFNYSYTTSNNHGGTTTKAETWGNGPWYCAGVIDPTATTGIGTHVMNGVYYNPNIYYQPPINSDGTSFPQADATLAAVDNDGVTAHRPLNPQSSGSSSFLNGTSGSGTHKTTTYWNCPYDGGGSAGGGHSSSPVSGAGGGPYYYKYTGPTLAVNSYGIPTSAALANLYNANNWTAVQVTNAALVINGTTITDASGTTVSQYQNWANWWAYYHTRNLMARTSLSRVFGNSSLASTTSSGGFGSSIRVAWQNLNDSSYMLTGDAAAIPCTPSRFGGCSGGSPAVLGAIISDLVDSSNCSASQKQSADPLSTQQQGPVKTPPDCYRSAFFNWIFQVGANGGTPTRSALDRAGTFFMRGQNNTGGTGNLEDPYWQPPVSGTGDGNELSCRQNFHMLVTDGLWNGNGDGPKSASLTLPSNVSRLPDNVSFPGTSSAGVTSIYAPVHDNGDSGYASLSDLAFHYWATDLRPDLYKPEAGEFVAPYLPDTSTSVFNLSTLSGSNVASTNINQEIYFNPANDPATWPHMSEYLIGLGVSGVLNISTNTDCTSTAGSDTDACNLRKGTTNSSGSIGWPLPNGSGNGIAANIDDTWHAALAGRGQFFSAGNPQDLVDQLTNVLSKITARIAQPTVSAVNASVLTLGALTFNTGYSSIDWSGVLQAVTLNTDGTAGATLWDAGAVLNDATATSPTNRQILTASMNSSGAIVGMAFDSNAAFDSTEVSGLNAPTATDTNDTLINRVNYLRGDRTEETAGVMRVRNNLLGAIINAQPVYVSYPSSGYTNSWPAGAPEAGTSAQTYDDFITANANRPGTLYMAANDGMLHAFNASTTCTNTNANDLCGKERWAYVPRAVYANLGNLTSKSSFKFAPTVDSTPVVRDVFFTDNKWHTILVGGLRLGGRGIYALDVTDPTAVTETATTKVLWEFDADEAATTAGNPANLGFTYGQPNIGRLANGKWVVLVPGGYFPDCSQPDMPANCKVIAAASNGYSSLFVLDAQTGAIIQELKTPTNITGVSSYGLSSPVLGDYNNDQIDDVAYAGDLAGNLWRFDLSDPTPANWSVALAYKPQTQGAQPITVMPRLFPDPATNRFMVVFGTGKYLGAVDNTSNSAAVQSVYGIRDTLDSDGNPITITHATLQAQTLTETTITDTADPNYGATVRSLTSNTLSASQGGWYFDLKTSNGSNVTDAGERVVVTPGAVFNTNTAVISTLIPGSSDPCNPAVLGAVMLVDATSGGAGMGVSSLGGIPYVGARVNNVRTSGTVPVTTTVGGGKTLFPGLTLTGKANNATQPLSGDAPLWRRRSWSILNP